MKTNSRLTYLLQEWRAIGSPPQESFNWSSSKTNWLITFPERKEFIEHLPIEISRSDLVKISISPKFDVIEKFLAVMIWGYGDRGYGPYRVAEMLKQAKSLEILEKLHEFTSSGEPTVAYNYLSQHRIKGLGPSYGTKVISFWTPREIGAPIYDSYIGMWLSEHAKEDFGKTPTQPSTWHGASYETYRKWVGLHAEIFQCFSDEVELTIFRDAEIQYSTSSKWLSK